ncbi:uncharacterized protein LOC122240155 [Panthera tigris]|uniref:uncharacterized protein LOC122240155 n=1 Tax=Panthera tigris TaxID=9694 RepID=UPI001C6F6B17|nr:uncharacterized protein LOC122240155 [Panthera tigris]
MGPYENAGLEVTPEQTGCPGHPETQALPKRRVVSTRARLGTSRSPPAGQKGCDLWLLNPREAKGSSGFIQKGWRPRPLPQASSSELFPFGREQGYSYRSQELPVPSFQDQLKPSSSRKPFLTTPAPRRPQRRQKTGVLSPNLQRTPHTRCRPDLQCLRLESWPRGQGWGMGFGSAPGLRSPQAPSCSASLGIRTATSSLIQGCLGL